MLLAFAAFLGIDYSAEIKRAVGLDFGNDACEQGAAASDAIIICGVRHINRFRIEEDLRRSSYAQRSRPTAAHSWFGWGNTGTGSCSAVGPGGYTGCLSRQIQSWRNGGGRIHF
jgi:hypothetical protein